MLPDLQDKHPAAVGLLTYAWVVIVSMWGGLANYTSRVRSGKIPRFSLMELAGELSISGFAGVLTFWLCSSAGWDQMLTAALVGISGYAGGRTIEALELFFRGKFNIPSNPGQ